MRADPKAASMAARRDDLRAGLKAVLSDFHWAEQWAERKAASTVGLRADSKDVQRAEPSVGRWAAL